jgi:hypothetical protein
MGRGRVAKGPWLQGAMADAECSATPANLVRTSLQPGEYRVRLRPQASCRRSWTPAAGDRFHWTKPAHALLAQRATTELPGTMGFAITVPGSVPAKKQPGWEAKKRRSAPSLWGLLQFVDGPI